MKIPLYIESAIIILFSVGVFFTFRQLIKDIDESECKTKSVEMYPDLTWMIFVLVFNVISTLGKALLPNFAESRGNFYKNTTTLQELDD